MLISGFRNENLRHFTPPLTTHRNYRLQKARTMRFSKNRNSLNTSNIAIHRDEGSIPFTRSIDNQSLTMKCM